MDVHPIKNGIFIGIDPCPYGDGSKPVNLPSWGKNLFLPQGSSIRRQSFSQRFSEGSENCVDTDAIQDQDTEHTQPYLDINISK
jgi:hypothetical protein